MSYTAKTNWQGNDQVTEDDLNRWEKGIKDSHEGLSQKIDVIEKGIAGGVATLDENGKLKSGQIDFPATPDGTMTTKGIVKLSSATDSTSETLAATPKAVKDAKDGLSTQIGILSDNIVPYGITSGADTKTITIANAFTSLKTGLALSFKNTTANTTAVTLNVNGLGAKPVLKSGGTALSTGNLKAGGVYTVRYDGTSFILQGEGGSGNAVASDLLSGKTASTDAGDITGTIPNRGTFNLDLGATVPAGYYSGGTVPTGAKYASGTIPFVANQGFSVTGLAFTPNRIYIAANGNVSSGGIGLYNSARGRYMSSTNSVVSGAFTVYPNQFSFNNPNESSSSGITSWFWEAYLV